MLEVQWGYLGCLSNFLQLQSYMNVMKSDPSPQPMHVICQHPMLKEECSAIVILSFEHWLVSTSSGHGFAGNTVLVEENSEAKLSWPTGDSARRVVRLTVLSADTRDIESRQDRNRLDEEAGGHPCRE
jgi:hypothetical protein